MSYVAALHLYQIKLGTKLIRSLHPLWLGRWSLWCTAILPCPPLCDIPSGCCFFTGPWTLSSLRMLRRVAAFCRPLRLVLLLVSLGLCPPPPSPVEPGGVQKVPEKVLLSQTLQKKTKGLPPPARGTKWNSVRGWSVGWGDECWPRDAAVRGGGGGVGAAKGRSRTPDHRNTLRSSGAKARRVRAPLPWLLSSTCLPWGRWGGRRAERMAFRARCARGTCEDGRDFWVIVAVPWAMGTEEGGGGGS